MKRQNVNAIRERIRQIERELARLKMVEKVSVADDTVMHSDRVPQERHDEDC